MEIIDRILNIELPPGSLRFCGGKENRENHLPEVKRAHS